jgi:hypothetical protein
MSIRVMSQVWDLALPAFEKLVLLALADCANDEGECWPSVSTLKRKTGAGERTIQRSIRALETLGIVERVETYGKSNRYWIHPRHIDTPATAAPRQAGTPPPPDRRGTPATAAPNPSLNRKEPSEVKSAAADRLTPSDILEGWNDLAEKCGLPKAGKLTGGRLRQAQARLREYPDLDSWQRALRHIHDTPFLRGENDRGWRADIDFLLQAKSFTKLTEESYGKAN